MACRASSANSRGTAWARSAQSTAIKLATVVPENWILDDLHRALGPDVLQQLSEKSGLSVAELTQKLSQILPQAVDTLTPGGSIPKG